MGTLDALTWPELADDLWLRARRERIPLTGLFELTPLCNFRCRMCYVRLNPEDVPRHGRIHTGEEWIELARQAMELGTYGITLSGGEPLAHPDFMEIYEGLSRMGLLVSVLSNGSLLNERHVELFTEYQPASIRFTLYGSSNETYERLCGARDGFDRVMRSTRMLKDAGLPVSFAFTETTENIGDFDGVIDVARSLDVPIIVATDLCSPVRGAESEATSLRVAPKDRPALKGKEGWVPMEQDKAILQAQSEGLLTGPFANCRSYRTFFFVDWNGYMENCATLSCCRSRPFEEGLAAAWNDMQDKLERLRMPDACIACEHRSFCTACPAKRQAETGRPDGIPARYCAEARQWHELWKSSFTERR